MNFFYKTKPSNPTQQDGLVGWIRLEQLHELEKKLEIVIKQNSVGEYDGHEIAVDYSDGSIYMYGPDAETLFNAIRPTLDNTSFMKGAQAILCFGPPDKNTRQIEITI